MSNLIRYIIQEDPEKEMRKKTWEKPTYSSIVAPQEEIEASKKRSQNLLESALSSYNTKHTPTPWAKKQSNNLLERMSMTTPSAPKRLENNTPNLNRSAAGDIALEGLKGFGQGIISGAESLLNGITLGGYSKVDEKYDLGVQNRRQDIQKAADNAGLGQALKVANKATEATGAAFTGTTILKGVPAAYNKYSIYKGAKNLEKQLRRGDDFQDIFMGRIDKNKLDEINSIRKDIGEPQISSKQVKILKNDVQHMWNRRVNEGRYSPEDVANSIKQSVFSKDSQVFPGNVSRNQVMIKTGNKHPSMSAITKDDTFKGVSIRSTMKKDLSTLLRKYPNLKH